MRIADKDFDGWFEPSKSLVLIIAMFCLNHRNVFPCSQKSIEIGLRSLLSWVASECFLMMACW